MVSFNSWARIATSYIHHTPSCILPLLLWFAYPFSPIFQSFLLFIFKKTCFSALLFFHQFLFPPYPRRLTPLQTTFLYYWTSFWVVQTLVFCPKCQESHTVTTNTVDICSTSNTFEDTAHKSITAILLLLLPNTRQAQSQVCPRCYQFIFQLSFSYILWNWWRPIVETML